MNLAGNYEPNPTGIATVTVTGKDEVAGTTKTEVDYTEAKNVYCGSLIDNDSDTWKKASQELYYKAGDGKYYPLYVKRSSYTYGILFQRRYYIYTWGYSKTDSSNDVTEITPTQQVLQGSASSITINPTVYTKTEKQITTAPTPASTNIVFKGVAAGTAKVTIGDTEYTVKVRKAPVTVTVRYVCDGEVLGLDLLRTGQTPEEVHVPEGTAILAVGNSVQTDILFLLYQTGDLGIFDLGQFFSGNFAGFKLAASFVDSLCAQEAADNIITIRSGIFHGGCPF